MAKPKGESLRSESAAWGLVMDHDREIVRYARRVSWRLFPASCPAIIPDAEQQARLASFWAALRFDPGRQVKFMTWAEYFIWLYVKRYFFKGGFTGTMARRVEVLPFDIDFMESGVLPTRDGVEDLLLRERDFVVLEEVNKLPERTRRILMQRIMEGLTYQKIGQGLGISYERVRKLQNAAVTAIRNRLLEMGLLENDSLGLDVAHARESGVASSPSG